MKRNTSVYVKNRISDDPSFVFMVSGLVNALLGPKKVILRNQQNGL